MLLGFWLVQSIKTIFFWFSKIFFRSFKYKLKRTLKDNCKSRLMPSRLRNLAVTIVLLSHRYRELEMAWKIFHTTNTSRWKTMWEHLIEKESSAFNVLLSFKWTLFLSKMWKNFSLKIYILAYFDKSKQLTHQPIVAII